MSRDASANMTEAELDALIAERMATMPQEGKAAPKTRAGRIQLRRLLANGNRLPVREIARRLGLSTRAVHQTVCNAIRTAPERSGWLSREMVNGEYVYFLTEKMP